MHTSTLSQDELDRIPTEDGIHRAHRHVNPLLCAVYLDVNHKESVHILLKNIKVTSDMCDWAVVTSEYYATYFPFRVTKYFLTSEHRYGNTKLNMFPLLSNISNGYHRIWLFDDDISLTKTDIGHFMNLWDLALWPHPAPLLVSSVLHSPSRVAYDVIDAKHWKDSDFIAVTSDFLPLRNIAMETSFFRWFDSSVLTELLSQPIEVGDRSVDDYWTSTAESLLCKSAEAFGALKTISHACAILTEPRAGVGVAGTAPRLQAPPMPLAAGLFPSWAHWPLSQSTPGRLTHTPTGLLISPCLFKAQQAEAVAGGCNRSEHATVKVALHITHIPKNAGKTHRATHSLRASPSDLDPRPSPPRSLSCRPPLYSPSSPRDPHSPLLVAFYFPQFHRDSLNDKLWGAGFTDWNNTLDKPSFNRFGHPILLPSESGLYDLTQRSVRMWQGCLAREHGIDAFAYHHYWFYDPTDTGPPPLSRALEALLLDGEPDLPFMLHWANHPWTNAWAGDAESRDQVLQDQYFPRDLGNVTSHYAYLRRFFAHKNYALVDGCPVFMVYLAYKTGGLPPILERLRQLAVGDGFKGLHLIRSAPQVPHPTETAHRTGKRSMDVWKDADRTYSADLFYPSAPENQEPLTRRRVPTACLRGERTQRGRAVYTGVISSFDNLPRRNFHSAIVARRSDAYPRGEAEMFKRDLLNIMYFDACCQSESDRMKGGKFVFINAWNEWGEGMVLEPSNSFGRSFLQAAKQAALLMKGQVCLSESELRPALLTTGFVDIAALLAAGANSTPGSSAPQTDSPPSSANSAAAGAAITTGLDQASSDLVEKVLRVRNKIRVGPGQHLVHYPP